jgi:cold shock protein
MLEGTVKFFKVEAGYGFIAQDGGTGADVFVHVTAVKDAGYQELVRGQRVRFNIGSNPKTGRDQATDLQLIEPVISPPVTPHAFRAESDLDEATSHMALATQAFMRR